MAKIQLSDIELHVVDSGRGLPLLLVHGFPLDHAMWAGQIEDLSSDFRVIAPDLRGFGLSDVTDGVVTMDRLADDLASLLEILGIRDRVVLCGLSMGGYVCWQFWRRHAARLCALVLCDTRAAADTVEAAQTRRETADRVVQVGAAFVAESMVDKLFSPHSRAHRQEMIRATQDVIRKTAPQGIAAALRGMAERPDSSGILGQIDLPTLVVCGRHDTISTVDEMRGIAAQIPQSQFVEIADAGHMSPLENPQQFNAAVRSFLSTIAVPR
jgi:pimeloyl-ACP methyl ester carboxylesterase